MLRFHTIMNKQFKLPKLDPAQFTEVVEYPRGVLLSRLLLPASSSLVDIAAELEEKRRLLSLGLPFPEEE